MERIVPYYSRVIRVHFISLIALLNHHISHLLITRYRTLRMTSSISVPLAADNRFLAYDRSRIKRLTTFPSLKVTRCLSGSRLISLMHLTDRRALRKHQAGEISVQYRMLTKQDQKIAVRSGLTHKTYWKHTDESKSRYTGTILYIPPTNILFLSQRDVI